MEKKYVERLEEICRKGLYMNPLPEKICGEGNKCVQAAISGVCFTEIRLSQTEKHTAKFGRLGIGFHRDFVAERGGNPVFYVQSGERGLIIADFFSLYSFVEKQPQNREAMKKLEILLGYLKGMSEPKDTQLKYYDEMEWRIVNLEKFLGKYISKKDNAQNVFRLDINPEDVKIIIFPTANALQLALKNRYILKFFKNHFPIMTTLDDCKNF